jgi:hypothetical protein
MYATTGLQAIDDKVDDDCEYGQRSLNRARDYGIFGIE